MRRTSRVVALAVGLMIMAAVSPAYYHFIHYTGRSTPYAPIPEKFNLDSLPGHTLQVFVSDQGQPNCRNWTRSPASSARFDWPPPLGTT